MTVSWRLALLSDPPDEGWHSMDVAAEGLEHGLRQWPDRVSPTRVVLPMPRVVRRLPELGAQHQALNADRLIGRFAASTIAARRRRTEFDAFHIVDHVYAHLTRVLPLGRSGVYCHDLDAFRSVVDTAREPKPAWFKAMTRASLKGLERAAVVFHSTAAVRDELVAAGIVDEARLVWAPYGVASEFNPLGSTGDTSPDILAPLHDSPFVLHVGSSLPRKRIDVLVDVMTELAQTRPDLWLVQVGADRVQLRAQAQVHGFAERLIQPPPIDRSTLAGLYRRATVVAVPSDAEGFGLPVIEAMACGTPVVASDIPVLREVGSHACTYVPVADVDAWVGVLAAIVAGRDVVRRQARIDRAARFTWSTHAATVAAAYEALLSR